MKKWIVFLMAVLAIQVHAADFVYKYLVVTSSDGTHTSLSSEGLKLTFDNGQLLAVNGNGSKTFTLTELANMQFTVDSSQFTVVSSQLTVHSSQLNVYTLSGMYVGTFDSASTLNAQLRSGVYVVKQNNKRSKIIVK